LLFLPLLPLLLQLLLPLLLLSLLLLHQAKAEAIAVIKEADGKTDNELGLKLKELPSSIEMLDEDFNSCQTKVHTCY
jgi:hypothetical protein